MSLVRSQADALIDFSLHSSIISSMGNREKIQPAPTSFKELKDRTIDLWCKRGVDGNGNPIKIERVAWGVILGASMVMDSVDLLDLTFKASSMTWIEMQNIQERLPSPELVQGRHRKLMHAREILVEDLKRTKPGLFKQLPLQKFLNS